MTPETPPAGSAPGADDHFAAWWKRETTGITWRNRDIEYTAFTWAKIGHDYAFRTPPICHHTPALNAIQEAHAAEMDGLHALAARLVAWYDTHCDPAVTPDEHAACELRALVDEARGVVATGERKEH